MSIAKENYRMQTRPIKNTKKFLYSLMNTECLKFKKIAHAITCQECFEKEDCFNYRSYLIFKKGVSR